MERNCHLIDLHKVIMAVILTAIKNQKNLHTLLDKPPIISNKGLDLMRLHVKWLIINLIFASIIRYNAF